MKKAQAALEYLMTYGWVFMVIFFTLSSLAYFGFLSPGRLLPKKCDISPGLTCDDFLLNVTNEKNFLYVNIINNFNAEITLSNLAMTSTLLQNPVICKPSGGDSIPVYGEKEIVCAFGDDELNLPDGDRVWMKIEGDYNAGLGTRNHTMFINLYLTAISD